MTSPLLREAILAGIEAAVEHARMGLSPWKDRQILADQVLADTLEMLEEEGEPLDGAMEVCRELVRVLPSFAVVRHPDLEPLYRKAKDLVGGSEFPPSFWMPDPSHPENPDNREENP